MKSYPNLCKPISIGGVTLKNRLFMAPMDTGFGNNAWGGFTPEGVEYFVRRAQGGWGLLFSGGTATDCLVDPADTLLNHPEEFLTVGREMNRRLHEYGCEMFIQLSFNVGRTPEEAIEIARLLESCGYDGLSTDAGTLDAFYYAMRPATCPWASPWTWPRW